jgi:hypothetical protein
MENSASDRTAGAGTIHYHCSGASRAAWLAEVPVGAGWSARNLPKCGWLGNGIDELATSAQSPNLPVNVESSSEEQNELLSNPAEADLLEIRAAAGAALVAQQIAFAQSVRRRRGLQNPGTPVPTS